MLLVTAAVWGVAFVAQKDGMDYVGPFTYNVVRFLLGGVFLFLLLPLLDRLRSREAPVQKGARRALLLGGIVCGAALFAASLLQQYGILLQSADTNVGKAGFITACYTVIVPVMGAFLGRKSPLLVWIGAFAAMAGFFFLSVMDGVAAGGGLSLELSDLLLLLCAAVFSVHILVVDRCAPLVDGVRLSCIQFFAAGLLFVPGMLLWERPAWGDILAGWLPILYGGVMSCGVAYTFQILGQRGVHPAVASLLLSLESVFSVLAGYVLMPGSVLTGWELLGCLLVFAAVITVQLAPAGRPAPAGQDGDGG